MRKIAFLLALAMILSLFGCGWVSVSGNHATTPEGIWLELLSAERTLENGTVLEVLWHNESDRDVLYGNAFQIFRLKGDSWVREKARPNTAFTMEAYRLKAHSTARKTYHLDWIYDVSREGDYRINVSYSFWDDEEKTDYEIWAEFHVDKNAAGEQQPQVFPETRFEDGTYIRITDVNGLNGLDRELLGGDQQYTSAFFRKQDLLILFIGSGSGSVKHSVHKTELTDGILTVWYTRTDPNTMTMDMARWALPVPVEKGLEFSDIMVRMGNDPARKLEPAETERVFHEPPRLDIVYDGGQTEAKKGTFSWFYPLEDGTMTAVMADGLHPLQMEKFLEAVSCGSSQIRLVFEKEPDSISVCCWPDSQWDKTHAAGETVKVRDHSLVLHNGGWIYEVTATWNENGGPYHGTATYVFYMAPALLHIRPY